ncbi:YybH family protein [Arthrobacter sp. MDT3-44]
MTGTHLTEEDVTRAAAVLVDAFRATDTRAYFDCFAEDATFVFSTEDRRLDSRGAYEQLWAEWLAAGWRVTACSSSNPRVQLLGDVAIFTHDVRTTTSTAGVPETTHERETIVFHRSGGAVRAVHEHLSPVPGNGRE